MPDHPLLGLRFAHALVFEHENVIGPADRASHQVEISALAVDPVLAPLLEARPVHRNRMADHRPVVEAEMLGDDAIAIFVAGDPVGADRLALLIVSNPLADPKVERPKFRPDAGRRRRRLTRLLSHAGRYRKRQPPQDNRKLSHAQPPLLEPLVAIRAARWKVQIDRKMARPLRHAPSGYSTVTLLARFRG